MPGVSSLTDTILAGGPDIAATAKWMAATRRTWEEQEQSPGCEIFMG
jgi:hypothetical protein